MGPSLSYKTLKEYGWRVIPNITSRFYIINGKIFYPWETARIGTSRRRSGHFNKKISCIITTFFYFYFLKEAARTVHMKSGHFIKNFSCIITTFFFVESDVPMSYIFFYVMDRFDLNRTNKHIVKVVLSNIWLHCFVIFRAFFIARMFPKVLPWETLDLADCNLLVKRSRYRTIPNLVLLWDHLLKM